jgi:hypothetical protein
VVSVYIDSHNRTAARPVVGSLWAWEPEKPHAAALIKVTSVRWNGEEWWVGTEQLLPGAEGDEIWNDLSRFWEACHYVAVDPGLSGAPDMALAVTLFGEPRPDEVTDEP